MVQESKKGTVITVMIEYDTQKSMCADCTHDFQCKRSSGMITLVDKENYLPAPQCNHHVAKPIQRFEGQRSLMDSENDRPFAGYTPVPDSPGTVYEDVDLKDEDEESSLDLTDVDSEAEDKPEE